MRRVVTYAKLLADHLGHSRTRPHLPPKAMSRCSSCQKLGYFRPLFFAEARLSTGRRPVLESLDALLLRPFHPLAHRTLAYAQNAGYVPLLPALLLELPRTQPSTFAPIGCFLAR